MFSLNNAVTVEHLYWLPQLQKAKVIIDATCGNGNDTLFIATHAAQKADITAIDIQKSAIANCQELLSTNLNRPDLTIDYVCTSHVNIKEISKLSNKKFDLVVFNLGYLPKGDHRIMTNRDSTILTIKNILPQLNTQGMITIVAYPGTKTGKEEMEAVEIYLKTLDQHIYDVSKWQPINQINNPPVLFIIRGR